MKSIILSVLFLLFLCTHLHSQVYRHGVGQFEDNELVRDYVNYLKNFYIQEIPQKDKLKYPSTKSAMLLFERFRYGQGKTMSISFDAAAVKTRYLNTINLGGKNLNITIIEGEFTEQYVYVPDKIKMSFYFACHKEVDGDNSNSEMLLFSIRSRVLFVSSVLKERVEEDKRIKAAKESEENAKKRNEQREELRKRITTDLKNHVWTYNRKPLNGKLVKVHEKLVTIEINGKKTQRFIDTFSPEDQKLIYDFKSVLQ